MGQDFVMGIGLGLGWGGSGGSGIRVIVLVEAEGEDFGRVDGGAAAEGDQGVDGGIGGVESEDGG